MDGELQPNRHGSACAHWAQRAAAQQWVPACSSTLQTLSGAHASEPLSLPAYLTLAAQSMPTLRPFMQMSQKLSLKLVSTYFFMSAKLVKRGGRGFPGGALSRIGWVYPHRALNSRQARQEHRSECYRRTKRGDCSGAQNWRCGAS